MTNSVLSRTLASISLLGLAAVALPQTASASGFAVARFGGPHGNPVDSHPASIYYNPAGLLGQAGQRYYLDVTYAQRNATYERDLDGCGQRDSEGKPLPCATFPGNVSADEPALLAANGGKGTLSNQVASPMVGASGNVGANFAWGAGFFVPFGGAAAWDKVDANASNPNPGAIDGPQRWFTIDGTLKTIGVAVGGAQRFPAAHLTLGLSANLYQTSIDTLRARNADNTDYVVSEGRSRIDVKGIDWGIGTGLIWEPRPNDLWVGLSYQSRPNLNGEMELEGNLTNFFAQTDNPKVIFTSTLPDVYRLGVKKRINGRDEFRLFGDFTRWSTFDQQCLMQKTAKSEADPFEFCATKSDGSAVSPENEGNITVNLIRRWEDAWGVRTGYSHYLAGGTELFADLGYDANAVPDTALEPSLMDMDKVSAGLGATFALMPTLDISVSANNIFYADRSTKASDFDAPTDPSKSPNPAGDFTQNVFFINVGLLYHTAPNVAAAVTAEDL